MNNIDYRFYDPDMREMHSMKGYDNGKITFEITEPSVIAQNNDIFPIKDVILMQYTGFRDKNGRKIYDGDILKSTFDKIEIKYHDGCFWIYDSDGYAYTIEIIDEAIDGNKIKHINIIKQVINAVTKLTEKENIYDNLSEGEKDIINKFKELYK